MSFESVLVALFAIATAVALAAQRLKIPYTVALVLAGLALGTTHALSPPHLTKGLLYSIFLPGLLFEAAIHLDFKRFWGNILAIGGLAIPGVLLSGLAMAPPLVWAVATFHFAAGFGFAHALLFAALIVATDPIAVVALFKTLGVPHRLATLVEGESLFNDGTAVAFYSIVLASVAGEHLSLGAAAVEFVKIAGLGLFVGAAIGFATSRLMRHIDDPMIEITLTTIAAYGSFVAAEALYASGVIATVTAGMLCGNYAARIGMSATTRLAVHSFWEYVAFALNSIVFLLIGLEVPIGKLLSSWRLILIVYLIVTVVRAILVFVMSAVVYPTRERMPWSWAAVLSWGGLRGALSMVLALSLPMDFAHKELIIKMTFGVVVLSILVQGLTMSPLLRLLRVVIPARDEAAPERAQAALFAVRAALHELHAIDPRERPSARGVAAVESDYEQRLQEAQALLAASQPSTEDDATREQRLRRRLLRVEKDALQELQGRDGANRAAIDVLLRACDERLLALDRAPDDD